MGYFGLSLVFEAMLPYPRPLTTPKRSTHRVRLFAMCVARHPLIAMTTHIPVASTHGVSWPPIHVSGHPLVAETTHIPIVSKHGGCWPPTGV